MLTFFFKKETETEEDITDAFEVFKGFIPAKEYYFIFDLTLSLCKPTLVVSYTLLSMQSRDESQNFCHPSNLGRRS